MISALGIALYIKELCSSHRTGNIASCECLIFRLQQVGMQNMAQTSFISIRLLGDKAGFMRRVNIRLTDLSWIWCCTARVCNCHPNYELKASKTLQRSDYLHNHANLSDPKRCGVCLPRGLIEILCLTQYVVPLQIFHVYSLQNTAVERMGQVAKHLTARVL